MALGKKRSIKHFFITGFPNFSAIKLIQKLTESEKLAKIDLLMLEKHVPLAKKLMKRLSKSAQKRVTFFIGDVTSVDLMLSGMEFNDLIGKITHILHLAAIWEYGVPKKVCEEINVGGTRRILAFAKECKNLKKLAYFSSIHVSGNRRGVIMESEFWKKQKFKNHQEESRFAAERLVHKAKDRGMPIVIFRLGNVVGDSQTGEIMKFLGPYIFVQLMLTTDRNLPVFFPGPCEAPSDIVPVDYMVNACLYILKSDKCLGETYHLTDTFPLAVRTIFEAVCSYLGRKPPTFGVPRSFYKAVFWIPGMERFAGIPKETFDYFNHKAVHNCQNTLEALKGSGISCPRFDVYFPIGIEFARDLLEQRLEKKELEQLVDPFDESII